MVIQHYHHQKHINDPNYIPLQILQNEDELKQDLHHNDDDALYDSGHQLTNYILHQQNNFLSHHELIQMDHLI